MRIEQHPILGNLESKKKINIEVDGMVLEAIKGEPIAAALLANGIRVCRQTPKKNEPRGIFCAIGQCTDCMMTVNGMRNVRTCVTPAVEGMKIKTPKHPEQDGDLND